jgi:hypothetical protein
MRIERGLADQGIEKVAGRKRQAARLQKEVALNIKLLRPMGSLLTKVIRPLAADRASPYPCSRKGRIEVI